MTPLEQALVTLARELDVPAAPDLAPAVRGRLEPRRSRRPLVLALAAAILVAVVAALAVPAARSTVLRFFHLGGVTVERVETLPPAREQPLAAGLGSALTPDAARRHLSFQPLLPPGLDRVYVSDGALLAILQERGKPVLLTEFEDSIYLKKAVGGQTRIQELRVGQDFGLWIEGARHVFQMPQNAPRMAGNVLIWTHRGMTLRLEGRLTRAEALRLALRVVQ
ncbi:MAG: hypothetical protein QOK32_1323 [Gaiellaceae bacterium]|nr:hypothetical protein [Gaiellaceae bacterium]